MTMIVMIMMITMICRFPIPFGCIVEPNESLVRKLGEIRISYCSVDRIGRTEEETFLHTYLSLFCTSDVSFIQTRKTVHFYFFNCRPFSAVRIIITSFN